MKGIASIVSALDQMSYAGVLFASLFSGFLIPLPEEIILLVVGYLGGTGVLNVYLAAAAAILGILAGDCLLFYLSRRESAYIERFARKVRGSHAKPFSAENAGRRIFALRFIAGLRFLSPIYSGLLRVSWSTFVFYDLLALFVYVPAIIFLGYHFHNSFLSIVTQVEVFRHALFSVLVLVLSIAVVAYINRRLDRMEKRALS